MARPSAPRRCSSATARRAGSGGALAVARRTPSSSARPIRAGGALGAALQTARPGGARGVAVSGSVGGGALKGPADGMLTPLGQGGGALGVARLYTGIADVFVF